MISQAKKRVRGRDVELARDLVRQDDLIVDNLNKRVLPDRASRSATTPTPASGR